MPSPSGTEAGGLATENDFTEPSKELRAKPPPADARLATLDAAVRSNSAALVAFAAAEEGPPPRSSTAPPSPMPCPVDIDAAVAAAPKAANAAVGPFTAAACCARHATARASPSASARWRK